MNKAKSKAICLIGDKTVNNRTVYSPCKHADPVKATINGTTWKTSPTFLMMTHQEPPANFYFVEGVRKGIGSFNKESYHSKITRNNDTDRFFAIRILSAMGEVRSLAKMLLAKQARNHHIKEKFVT